MVKDRQTRQVSAHGVTKRQAQASKWTTTTSIIYLYNQIRSVLSRVRLFVAPWIEARQASLSITNSWSSRRLTSIQSLMPSSHKTLESPLDCKEIQPVHSKGDQSWVFFGRNDANAESPVLWPPHAKSWLIGKDSDAGRDWGQEEKGMTEDEIAGWHHRLDGHESG